MKPVIIKALNWRYATKKFDATKKISDADKTTLLEAARLAPSSYGLQPWKFIVVEKPELRTALRGAAWDQTQVTDASLLVILAVPKEYGPADIEKYVAFAAGVQGVPVEKMKGYLDMMLGAIAGKSQADIQVWNAKQAYIALGFMLETAALLEIDACPMEGFDKAKFDEILGLGALGLQSQVMITLGYRASDDTSASRKKVRFNASDVVIKM